MKRISVVAPAYNEEECISLFVGKTIRAFKDNNLKGEIIIVNDGSTDKTGVIAQNIAKKEPLVRLINNRKNIGLTGAAWIGFNNAKEDIIVFLPSDLESDPEEDIPILLKPLDEGYDMAVGKREGSRLNTIKSTTSFIFNMMASLIFKVPVHDLGWIKAFKKEVISDLELRSDWHRFLVIFVADKGYKIKEVSTKFHPRKKGKSKFGKFGLMRLPGGFFDLIAIRFLLSFSRKPMFVFGSFGMIFLVLGSIGGAYLAFIKILGKPLIPRMPLLFLVVLFILSGIQLFALGFLAEFLVSIRESINKKK
ncbi:MAG: glycosyltransferase family 2 protein [Nanoarchaeota archaeon]